MLPPLVTICSLLSRFDEDTHPHDPPDIAEDLARLGNNPALAGTIRELLDLNTTPQVKDRLLTAALAEVKPF